MLSSPFSLLHGPVHETRVPIKLLNDAGLFHVTSIFYARDVPLKIITVADIDNKYIGNGFK